MSKHIALKAESRTLSGKGAARAIRKENKIPGVIYGMGKTPDMVAMTSHGVMMAMQKGGFFNHIIDLEVDGKVQQVLAREAQRNPVNDKIIHLDFLRFNPKALITINVPLELVDEDKCPGVKEGNLPQLAMHELEVECRADSIPEIIYVSVAGLHTGQSISLGELKLPEGVTATADDMDLAIATVLDTTVVEPVEPVVIETEVLTEKKPTAEEAAAAKGAAPAKADAKPAAKK